jgi:hypothetical protein
MRIFLNGSALRTSAGTNGHSDKQTAIHGAKAALPLWRFLTILHLFPLRRTIYIDLEFFTSQVL